MYRNTLSKLYGYNVMVIEKNIDGISNEESFFQPQPGGNCLNWVLGHIVATRNPVMKIIGENPVWSEEETAPYRRGSPPLTSAETAIPLEKILSDLKASQDKLISKLGQMSSEDLETPLEDGTRYEQLAVLQFHEAYHAGQLGTLRRFIGKTGAIK
jgi:hypothetical protein